MREEDIVLENRRALYRYVQDNPGSHLRKISRELDMKMGTLRYHLDYLEKKELVSSRKESNLKVYFITKKLGFKHRNVSPLLQQKRFRDIALVIIDAPGSSHRAIAKKLSLNPSTLTKYMKILEKKRVAYHEKIGREKRYFLFDEKLVVELLMTYRKSFWDPFVDNVLEIYFER